MTTNWNLQILVSPKTTSQATWKVFAELLSQWPQKSSNTNSTTKDAMSGHLEFSLIWCSTTDLLTFLRKPMESALSASPMLSLWEITNLKKMFKLAKAGKNLSTNASRKKWTKDQLLLNCWNMNGLMAKVKQT